MGGWRLGGRLEAGWLEIGWEGNSNSRQLCHNWKRPLILHFVRNYNNVTVSDMEFKIRVQELGLEEFSCSQLSSPEEGTVPVDRKSTRLNSSH